MSWLVTVCHDDGDRGQVEEHEVDTRGDVEIMARLIEEKHHGTDGYCLVDSASWSADRGDFIQWGTNYHWISASRIS